MATILRQMHQVFLKHHELMKREEEAANEDRTKVKNILNCLLHLFLFQSLDSEYLFDIIRFLMDSFSEADIEVLIFVLHNIGL